MKITKQIKIGIIAIFSIGIIFGLYKLNDYLSREKRWFYATATDVKAFDKLYWGMSKEEVERVLNKKLLITKGGKNDLPIMSIEYEIRFRKAAKKGFKYSKIAIEYFRGTLFNYDSDFYGEDIDDLELHFYKNQLFKITIKGKLWSYKLDYEGINHFDSLIVFLFNLFIFWFF